MLAHLRPQGPARVLILSGDAVMARAIAFTLNHGAFMAKIETEAASITKTADEWRPHVVVCDLESTVGLAFSEMLSPLSSKNTRIPAVFLTRKNDLKAKLALFYAGADDILSFPYAPEDLLARILAVVRRSYQTEPAIKAAISVEGMELDIMNRRVTLEGHDALLTSLELSILYLLAANPGEVFSRSDIIIHLWGPDYVAESNIIDNHIRNLRVKLNNSWRVPRYIFTVPGQGYCFGPPPRTRAKRLTKEQLKRKQ